MRDTRVNEIDLLRFMAALAVVFYHYAFRGYAADGLSTMPYPWLAPTAKYGYLGVELFFMISGFVVLMTAEASARVRDFSISRIVRLYPAYWICCTITCGAMVAFGMPKQDISWNQYIVNMTMLTGLTKVPLLDGAYWSLLVEIRFYALVAVVLAFRKVHQSQRYLIIWLAATISLELLPILARSLSLELPDSLRYLRYLLIVNYSAYFIAGATCYLLWVKGFSLKKFLIMVACWGLALFQVRPTLVDFEVYYKTSINANLVFAIITIFFLIMLAISLRWTGVFSRFSWPMAGALSYPLYLLHQNIGYIIFRHFYPRLNPHFLLFGTLIFVLAAAYVVHEYAERPFASKVKKILSARFTRRVLS